MLIDNPKGNYRFLKGNSTYSSAVVAALGYEIVNVTLSAPLPLQSSFQLIAHHLATAGRPIQATCAVELLSPYQFSFDRFATFNHGYHDMLADVGILVDGVTPVARTNIAPEIHPPVEPCLSAFSYTVPQTQSDARRTFVVAGASELLDGELNEQAIVWPNDVSEGAMREKAAHVMQSMTVRLQGIGVSWSQVNVINIYTVHEILPFLRNLGLGDSGVAVRHAVRWHYAHPPVAGLEFEMDVRSVRSELHLD